MKSVALMLPGMRMGGAEKICINFLSSLITKYKVTLILSKKEGELLSFVPECVDIVEDSLFDFRTVFVNDLKKLRVLYLLKDIKYYLKSVMGKISERDYRYIVGRTPFLGGEYDCAIGYVANVSTQIFSLADRINADIKIAWIHGETNSLYDTPLYEKIFSSFDRVFTVSDVTKAHFIEKYPMCERNTDVYYNPINALEIIEKSKEEADISFSNEEINIVTVGRITSEKGMDMIPEIVSKLIEQKLKIHWYIVGDGPSAEKVKALIEKYAVSDYVTMVGMRANPYPFIHNCDIYVQPSYEEGYSTTICEAAILGRAIVGTTTSGGIREQITDNVDGSIAEPNSDSLAKKIERLIVDTQFKKMIEHNIASKDFSNKNEFRKIEQVIG